MAAELHATSAVSPIGVSQGEGVVKLEMADQELSPSPPQSDCTCHSYSVSEVRPLIVMLFSLVLISTQLLAATER